MKPIPLTLGEVANFGIAKLLFYVNMSAPNTHYTLPPLLWKLFALHRDSAEILRFAAETCLSMSTTNHFISLSHGETVNENRLSGQLP